MGFARELVVKHREQLAQEAQQAWFDRHLDHEPKLHPSGVGGCPRKAIWQAVDAYADHPLHVETTHPFDQYVEEVMLAGRVWEEANAEAFTSVPGGEHHFKLVTDMWVGEPDFVVRDDPFVHIIEHKDTSEYNFRRRKDGYRIPYDHHVIQLACYALLAEDVIDAGLIDALLYYNGRGHWAEFRVEPKTDSIQWEGNVDGDDWVSGVVEFGVRARMNELEEWFEAGELPPRYDSPFQEDYACTRGYRGKYHPNCQYYGHCWPELPQEGPFGKGVWTG